MESSQTPSPVAGGPGVISMFFIVKAAFFAAAAWVWLAVLILRDGPATGVTVFAAAAGICFTLVAVILGVRYAMAGDAARRHAAISRILVEISWHTLVISPDVDEQPAKNVFPLQSGGSERTRR